VGPAIFFPLIISLKATATAATATAATATATGQAIGGGSKESSSGTGLSEGSKIALGTSIPFGVLAVLIGGVALYFQIKTGCPSILFTRRLFDLLTVLQPLSPDRFRIG
jgi:hypothetical protein